MINWVMLFPEARNVHIIKSNGMVPFSLSLLGNYNCKFVCYKNEPTYDYIHEYNSLKLEFLRNKYNNKIFDSWLYLRKNSKNIDVLHLYHLTYESFFIALIYKMYNKNGCVYLKADNSQDYLFDRSWPKDKLKLQACKIFDVVTCESKNICKYVNDNYSYPIKYIPNGFYQKNYNVNSINCKEKIILSVGRIGAEEKAYDILVESFCKASEKCKEWKLILIGPVTNDFQNYISDLKTKYPELSTRIILKGPIHDRNELNKEYDRASIFSLSSVSEGFPTVFLEAMKSGCYLTSTDIPIAKEVIVSPKIGMISEGNKNCYAKMLEEAIDNVSYNFKQEDVKKYVYDNFYWPNTAKKIDNLIIRCLNDNK